MGRCDDIHEALHSAICERLGRLQPPAGAVLLDVGCWDGSNTIDYARAAGIALERTAGVEYFEDQAAVARGSIRCEVLDIEEDRLPFPDATIDVAVCNQVFEHCKNIFRPLSEIRRVLKPGGSLIFSVPNLASLHNRLMLLAGRQPSSIRVIGPHVGGFTHHAVVDFLELNGLFAVRAVTGVGFYPLPIAAGAIVARWLPGLSHTTVLHAVRTAASAPDWEAVMRERGEQTAFFEA